MDSQLGACPLERGQVIRFAGSNGLRTVMAIEPKPQQGEFDVKLDDGSVLSVKPPRPKLSERFEKFVPVPPAYRQQWAALLGELRAVERVTETAEVCAKRLEANGSDVYDHEADLVDAVQRLRMVRGEP